jgi:hypothetical protein
MKVNQNPKKNNAKTICITLTILALTAGTCSSMFFNKPEVALCVIYAMTLIINAIIIENEV